MQVVARHRLAMAFLTSPGPFVKQENTPTNSHTIGNSWLELFSAMKRARLLRTVGWWLLLHPLGEKRAEGKSPRPDFGTYRQTARKPVLWHRCSHFCLSWCQLRRTLGGQRWRNYLREKSEMQSVPKHSALLKWHRSPVVMRTAPYRIPQYLASIIWKALGRIFFFSRCFPKSWRQVSFFSRSATNRWKIHTFSTGCRDTPSVDEANKHHHPCSRSSKYSIPKNVILAVACVKKSKGPHRDRGLDRDRCPGDAALPPANHRGAERGAGEAQAQPSAQLAPRRWCLRTQGVNKGKIFQTILM